MNSSVVPDQTYISAVSPAWRSRLYFSCALFAFGAASLVLLVPNEAAATCVLTAGGGTASGPASGAVVTCDTNAPNPFTAGIDANTNSDNVNVILQPGASIGTAAATREGVHLDDDITVQLGAGASITTQGGVSDALRLGDNATVTTSENAVFSTTSGTSDGIELGNNASVTLGQNGRISTTGNIAVGLKSGTNTTVMLNSGASITTTGNISDGITSGSGLTVTLRSGARIQTSGAIADAIQSTDDFTLTMDAGSSIQSGPQSAIRFNFGDAVIGGAVSSATARAIVVAGNVANASNITVTADGRISNGSNVQTAIDAGTGVQNITVAGRVQGGDANGNGQAITLGDGADRLELQPGFTVIGSVRGENGTDTLAFGGDGTQTFDVSLIDGNNTDDGEQYREFETFVKEDSSTFNLTGTNTEIGAFAVNGGLLNVNGTMANTAFAVNGGTLGGAGTLGSFTVANGALVAPGNSIGTLNVAGNVLFNAGSTFQVEVAADGTSDKVEAGGTATINGGTVEVKAIDPHQNYTDGQRYTILTANAGVTGRFAGVSDDSAFLDFTLAYDAMNVFLDLSKVAAFSSVAQTPNQKSVASALDNLDQANADALAVNNALLGLNENEARAAFDAIQGEAHADAAAAAAASAGQFTQLLQANGFATGNGGAQRFALAAPLEGIGDLAAKRDAEAGPATLDDGTEVYGSSVALTDAPDPASNLSAWFGGFGGYAEVDGDANASGYDNHVWGLAGGLESDLRAMTGLAARAGFGVGYSSGHTDLDSRVQHAELDSWHLGLYASAGAAALEDGLAVRGAASYTFHEIDTKRTIAFGTINRIARSGYDAHSFAGDIEARYNFTFDPAMIGLDRLGMEGVAALSPFARLQVAHTSFDRFTETGAGSLNLSGRNDDLETANLALGVALSGSYALANGMVWKPSVSVAYERLLADDNGSANLALAGSPTGFTVAGPSEARDRLRFGSVSELAITETASLTFATDSVISEDRTEFSGKVALKLAF